MTFKKTTLAETSRFIQSLQGLFKMFIRFGAICYTRYVQTLMFTMACFLSIFFFFYSVPNFWWLFKVIRNRIGKYSHQYIRNGWNWYLGEMNISTHCQILLYYYNSLQTTPKQQWRNSILFLDKIWTLDLEIVKIEYAN